MVYLISDILTKDECKYLTKQFDIERTHNESVDYEYAGTNISYGFEPSFLFNTYLDKLKLKVLKYNPNMYDLLNVNTYVREYVNHSKLDKHIDRKEISVTMSICLESTINKDWPLFVEIDGNEYSYHTNVGDGIILFDADKNIHWRNDLICNENERILQFFLHWKPVDNTIKKTKSLI